MSRSLIYGTSVAAAALLLQWLEYQHALRMLSVELYIVLLAVAFTALGVWLGTRLTRPRTDTSFTINLRAIESLGLTPKELDVLAHLATGKSNAEIAKALFVSTSTVKTHLLHLYQKLEVARRTQAVHKAKELHIIP